MSINKEIASAVSPLIESTGNYLEEVKVVNAGKNKLITIIVDSDSHLNLDQVTQILIILQYWKTLKLILLMLEKLL